MASNFGQFDSFPCIDVICCIVQELLEGADCDDRSLPMCHATCSMPT